MYPFINKYILIVILFQLLVTIPPFARMVQPAKEWPTKTPVIVNPSTTKLLLTHIAHCQEVRYIYTFLLKIQKLKHRKALFEEFKTI